VVGRDSEPRFYAVVGNPLHVSANRADGLPSWKIMRPRAISFTRRGPLVYKCAHGVVKNGNPGLGFSRRKGPGKQGFVVINFAQETQYVALTHERRALPGGDSKALLSFPIE